jgi:hypothetical protein
METLLLFLPTIFCFFSGILVSWGAYLAYGFVATLTNVNDKTDKLAEIMCIVVILTATVSILLLLFLFTAFAAFHMSTILFLEIWYTFFLYRLSVTPGFTPCHIILQHSIPSKPLFHIHK